MTDLTPTAEQQLIIEHAYCTSDNILISALAGAAKTTTLLLIAKKLRKTMILCVAFNKRIADEMTQRLPGNCTSVTLNALGHRAWAEAVGKRLILDRKKNYKILSSEIEKLSTLEKKEAYKNFAETLKLVAFGKACGYVPSGHFKNAKGLLNDAEFFAHMDEEPTALQEKLLSRCAFESIKQGFAGQIDFDDQILLPTVFPASFPTFPLILLDEAQDLSALNHRMLGKFARKRLIAVGDECQAIYGFRGAHQDSMNLMQEKFKMTSFVLSISFRCPKSVVAEAQWRAPHMVAPDFAKQGIVRTLDTWDVDTPANDAVIICRNNAPLFRTAIRLLQHGRYPKLIGNDIGKQLLRDMKRLGKTNMKQKEVLLAIDAWEQEKLTKTRATGALQDRAKCMRIFTCEGKDLGEAMAYAEHLFRQEGPIQLMTGHKSKGLEFDDVYFLDQHLIDMEYQQERNLRYVVQTRTKQYLTYIESKGFVSNG